MEVAEMDEGMWNGLAIAIILLFLAFVSPFFFLPIGMP
jgi:hypothetical protein